MDSSENKDVKTQIGEFRFPENLYRQLGTRSGFFQYYFKQLDNPKYRTYVECFNAVNDLHFELFGEYRYESYDSFRKQVNYYNTNKK
jgi:hypothetical protein